jgi:hypothetical protein
MKQEVDVKNFIHNQLKIDENIELHVAHRLRKRRDGRPRNAKSGINTLIDIVIMLDNSDIYF